MATVCYILLQILELFDMLKFFSLFSLIIIACGGGSSEDAPLPEVGKKVYLKELPDSTYLANRELKTENRRRGEVDTVPDMGLKLYTDQLKSVAKKHQPKTKKQKQNKTMSSEEFSDYVLNCIEAYKNQGKASCIQKVSISQNGEIEDFLQAYYPKYYSELPEQILISGLKSINKNLNFTSLQKGEFILVPKKK